MAGTPERTLLIVEDDPGLQSQMRWCFDESVSVQTADNGEDAVAALRRFEPQVVTLDLGLPPDPGGAEEGFKTLAELLRLAPKTKVIVITGREEHEHAVRAVAEGAFDFYQKPVEAETLRFVVERAFRIRALEDENERLQASRDASPLDGIIGASEAMVKLCRKVEKIAPADVSVLIQGETGTGKELIARALHRLSRRSDGPFVAINCAAIPENLLESELFGYEKGAFTGASSQKKGRIEDAQGGTLFLDEIGDMPLPLQAKMLRFLQERSFERVGGNKPIAVDVRVISATHRDLTAMVGEQTFREDLYYRLGELGLRIPPLRERAGDAVLLALALLKRYGKEYGAGSLKLTVDAGEAIEAWEWPGNVREMENRIKRAVVLCEGRQVTAEDLELTVNRNGCSSNALNLREIREKAEEQAVRQALVQSQGNISHASRLLGITRPTLYDLLKRFRIKVQ
ncbi:MAG: PEP-CTERM-box response regulator transcription factor [Pseudomonadales bacterium]|nr:PEP-CTERM-box response regulator transcription factor [Pseudomonadales bacterium]